MIVDLPPELWKKSTSTVGLVSVRHDGGTNVMAAEWSYFVNKDPLYVAVVLGGKNVTRTLLEAAGEFSLTFCAEDQAAVADFAGSFHLTDIDKSGSDLLRWEKPDVIATAWVAGGVLAVECVLQQTVAFPVHTMYVGHVVAAHLPATPVRPLVKHGGMYTLGDRVNRTEVAAAAQLVSDRRLRVAATAPPGLTTTPWQVSLHHPDGDTLDLGEFPSGQYGDLLVDIPLPADLAIAGLNGRRVRVHRDGTDPGFATVTGTRR